MNELPQGFIDSLGADPVFDGLARALADTAPCVSVRLNAAKGGCDFDGAEPVPWCADGVYLPERPAFTLDPALHQGRYYVQEASSMAHQAAVRQALAMMDDAGPLRYLDACAAPGGKTIGAMAELPEGSLVVANEYDPARANVLAENLAKWGSPLDVAVTRGDAAAMARLERFFDVIGTDVPCSGEGMMRKDAAARAQWSHGLVAECAARQRDIVDALWQALRPGGFLIYSTCTFNRDENELIISRLIDRCGAEPCAIPALDAVPGIVGAVGADFPAYRFLPGRIRGEGLFLALLRKPDSARGRRSLPKGANNFRRGPYNSLLRGEMLFETAADGTVSAVTAANTAAMSAVSRAARTITRGLTVGTLKGRDLVPSQALAMSLRLASDAFARVEVDHGTALEYLRRNAITLPDGTPRGHILLTRDAHPLGFVKNLGSRSNNLYPLQWRIRLG